MPFRWPSWPFSLSPQRSGPKTRRKQPGRGCVSSGASAPSEPILLWPGVAPGEKGDIGEEKQTPGKYPRGRDLIMVTNVTKPTITVFRPAADKNTGAAVIVCPGGGYGVLAYDFEGTEVCQWLNSIGVTGVLLKYRVPGRGGQRFTAPLQDAQRAIGLVRSRPRNGRSIPSESASWAFPPAAIFRPRPARISSRDYPAIDAADKKAAAPILRC